MTQTSPPKIRSHVVLLARPRRPQHPDKDLIDLDLNGLSSRYNKPTRDDDSRTQASSLHQDIDTGERVMLSAVCNSVAAWSFAPP